MEVKIEKLVVAKSVKCLFLRESSYPLSSFTFAKVFFETRKYHNGRKSGKKGRLPKQL